MVCCKLPKSIEFTFNAEFSYLIGSFQKYLVKKCARSRYHNCPIYITPGYFFSHLYVVIEFMFSGNQEFSYNQTENKEPWNFNELPFS